MKKEKERQLRLQQAEQSRVWAYESTVAVCNLKDERTGNVVVPTKWPTQPNVNLRARGLDEKQVVVVMNNILNKAGMQESTIRLLAWREDVEDAGYDPENLVLDSSKTVTPFLMQAIAGAHSLKSVSRFHKKASKNPKFATVSCRLLICSRTDIQEPERHQSATHQMRFGTVAA
jgi:hypothetical protein